MICPNFCLCHVLLRGFLHSVSVLLSDSTVKTVFMQCFSQLLFIQTLSFSWCDTSCCILPIFILVIFLWTNACLLFLCNCLLVDSSGFFFSHFLTGTFTSWGIPLPFFDSTKSILWLLLMRLSSLCITASVLVLMLTLFLRIQLRRTFLCCRQLWNHMMTRCHCRCYCSQIKKHNCYCYSWISTRFFRCS